MRPSIRFWQLGVIISGIVGLGACTTWRTQHAVPMVFVNETRPSEIRIERSDASRMVLTQPVVVGDSIRGPQGAVAAADIRRIAVRRFDVLKTLGLVGGILAAGGIVCLASDCMDFGLGGLDFSGTTNVRH